MRLRILTAPTRTLDGVSLTGFRVGHVYTLRNEMACVFLAEGWAVAVNTIDPPVDIDPTPAEVGQLPPLVLVIEDEADEREFIGSLLTSHGYDVVMASQGQEGLERLRERCPDLIVMDLDMPVMDGRRFRTQQRYFLEKTRADVPVLLVTGSDEAMAHAELLRTAGVITKPFEPNALLRAMAAALGPSGATGPADRTPL